MVIDCIDWIPWGYFKFSTRQLDHIYIYCTTSSARLLLAGVDITFTYAICIFGTIFFVFYSLS